MNHTTSKDGKITAIHRDSLTKRGGMGRIYWKQNLRGLHNDTGNVS